MASKIDKTKEFHKKIGDHIGESPSIPPEEVWKRRQAMLQEEVSEFFEAEDEGDLNHIAKELTDILYLVYGNAVAYGFPLDELFDEVHRSNMSKFGIDADGKAVKKADYIKADIERVLESHEKRQIE